MTKEHEHEYVAETYTTQKLDNKYVGSSKYQMATLEQQNIIIFCRICGDSKLITSTETDSQQDQ